MNIVVVTPPASEPVSMREVFMHLRLDDPDSPEDHPDYDLLVGQLASARGEAEKDTRRAFIQQSLRLVGAVPAGPTLHWYWRNGPAGIELLRPPLINVTSLRYFDEANVLQTVDPANYYVTDDFVPKLLFVDGFCLPCTYRRGDAVRVDYVAGYPPVPASGSTPADPAGNVPNEIKQGILMGVQLLYDDLTSDQREALTKARDSLLGGKHVPKF